MFRMSKMYIKLSNYRSSSKLCRVNRHRIWIKDRQPHPPLVNLRVINIPTPISDQLPLHSNKTSPKSSTNPATITIEIAIPNPKNQITTISTTLTRWTPQKNIWITVLKTSKIFWNTSSTNKSSSNDRVKMSPVLG